MTKKKYDDYLEEIQERMDGDVFKTMLEVMARQVMEKEVARHLGALPHQRTESRKGHRNGYKPRTLKTGMGELKLEIPQTRGVEPYAPTLFAKWQRSERALLRSLRGTYLRAISSPQ